MSNFNYFYNLTEDKMKFEEVYHRIYNFIKADPRSEYILSIGTDSQVHPKSTRFITAVHLHRKGKGAWGCLRNYDVPRRMMNVKEKISLETSLSQEIACYFTPDLLADLTELLLPHVNSGAELMLEIHLDIGKNGLTKELIKEMTSRIKAMGIKPRIKPNSYTASSYANKYTK